MPLGGVEMPNVYQQSFSLLEALWQPLVQHGIIEKASAPMLASWITQNIGASFPSSASEESARRRAYTAYHSWNEYRAGDFDKYFWGAETANEETASSDAHSKETPGLAQLLPPASSTSCAACFRPRATRASRSVRTPPLTTRRKACGSTVSTSSTT